MICHQEVVRRWIEHLFGRTDVELKRTNYVIPRGDEIFSYGSHFEIARVLRDKAGQPERFLINGDVWGSNSTARHQSEVRHAIARTELPRVIIPYQALNAAGIDRNSVQILEVTPDKYTEKDEVHVDQLPPGCSLYWDEIHGSVELTDEELQRKVDKRNLEKFEEWAGHQRYVHEELTSDKPEKRFWTSRYWLKKCPDAITLEQWRSQLSAYDAHHATRETRLVGHQLKCGRRNSWRLQYEISYLDDGRTEYRRTIRRHWLGESLIEARIAYQAPRTCKWCKASGRAEGPLNAHWVPPRPRTEWGSTGVINGQYVNPGRIDILQDAPGYWEEHTGRQPLCTACNGRGRWSVLRHRTAKFLSGFDANETRSSYFFCELPPKSSAVTVAEAYGALKPEAVVIAEEQGRMVRRQGDIYAIRLSPNITKRSLRKAGARFEKRGSLFGTNHVATEVAYLPNGNTLVRGVLYHAPQWRSPDHARVRLDDGWHVVQKNLVPIAA